MAMLGQGRRPAPARAGPQPRSAAGAGRAAARARSARSARSGAAPHRRTTSTPSLVGAGRPRRPAGCARPGGWAARSSLRLRFDDFTRATRSHTLPRATAHTHTILAAARGLLADGHAADRASAGCTLVGIAVGNLDDDDAVQLALPFDGRSSGALDAALDEVRERFGSAAVTRAVLLGRDQGQSMPMLPD